MKFFYFVIIVTLFLVPVVNADPLEIEFLQSGYSRGETIQAWINVVGDLEQELRHTDIGLQKNGQDVIVYPYLVKLNDETYFAYFTLPFSLDDGSYNFVIEDVLFLEGGVLVTEDITEAFSLSWDGSIGLIPGIFKVEDVGRDYIFQLFVKNNKNEAINVQFSKTKPYLFFNQQSFLLNPGQERVLEIFFDHTHIGEGGDDVITISGAGSYEVPFWIDFVQEGPINQTNQTQPQNNVTNQTQPQNNVTNQTQTFDKINFINQISYLNKTLGYGEKTEGSLFFKNYFSEGVHNISFIFTGNLNQIAELDTYSIDYLESQEIGKTVLRINKIGNSRPGIYSGSVRMDYEDQSEYFPVNIIIAGEQVTDDVEDPVVDDDGFVQQDVNYSEEYNYNYTSDYDEPESGRKWIWIFLIVLGVIGIILLIFFLVKNKKKESSLFP